jgi:hypothetical protein
VRKRQLNELLELGELAHQVPKTFGAGHWTSLLSASQMVHQVYPLVH